MKHKKLLAVVFVLSLLFQSRNIFIPPFTQYDWRQWDTFAVVRNFRLEGMNLFKPHTNQIYIESADVNQRLFLLDFPIYTYLSALLTYITGVNPITLRILDILLAASTSVIVFKISQNLVNDTKTGIISVVLLNLSPIFQFSSNSMQPDILMILFFSLVLLFLLRKEDELNTTSLVFLSLGVLIKPYILIFFLPILIYKYYKTHDFKYLLHMIIPSVLYILWLVRGATSESGKYWYTAQLWVGTFTNSWNFDISRTTFDLLTRITVSILTIPILLVTTLGFKKLTKDLQIKFSLIFIGFLIYLGLFIPGNYNHIYYQLPILIPIYVLAAIGVMNLISNKNYLKAIGLLILSIPFYILPSNNLYKELFRQHAIYQDLNNWQFQQKIIPAGNSVIYFNAEGSPVMLNMLGRNGWVYRFDLSCDQVEIKIRNIKPDYALIFSRYIDTSNHEQKSDDNQILKCLKEFTKSVPIYRDEYMTVFTIKPYLK